MGVAIIVPDVDFSTSNLGQVTLVEEVPVQSITINGEDSITGSGTFSVSLTPASTTQRDVTWSIISGDTYASINSSGVVTVANGAIGETVVIQATSTSNPSIIATKTIVVYESGYNPLIFSMENTTTATPTLTEYDLCDGSIPTWTLFVDIQDIPLTSSESYMLKCNAWNSDQTIAYSAAGIFVSGNNLKVLCGNGLDESSVVYEGRSVTAVKVGFKRIDNVFYYTFDGSTWASAITIDDYGSTITDLIIGGKTTSTALSVFTVNKIYLYEDEHDISEFFQ